MSRTALGLDLGTSSLKCVLLDETGGVRATARVDFPTASPAPGWAEQSPADWIEALRQALAVLRVQDAEGLDAITCIGICSAAHLPVLLDAGNEVIRPAILWSDQRSVAEVAVLAERHNRLVTETTLNQPSCTWTLPQVMWVKQNEPANHERIRTLLSSKDYLVFLLTGQRRMDYGSGAATLLMNAGRQTWVPELVELAGLAKDALPPLTSAGEIVGRVLPVAAQRFGLPADVPVIAGCLDSASEIVGCGLLGPEDGGMVRVGSSGGIMAFAPHGGYVPGVINYPFVADGLRYWQAGTNTCATCLHWIKGVSDGMASSGGGATYEYLDSLVAETPPGADGMIFHPYLQGERAPYWNPHLRASFTGIHGNHGWPDFVRAVMEGVAYSLKDCLGMFEAEGLRLDRAVLAGGITKSRIWSQIIADVLGIELFTIRNGDSAFGAAMMAGVGGGLFRDLREAAAACVALETTVHPNKDTAGYYGDLFRRYQDLARSFNATTR